MRLLMSAVIVATVSTSASGQELEWPAELGARVSDAARILSAAEGDERLSALTGVIDAIGPNGDAPNAALMLRLSGDQIGGEVATSRLGAVLAGLRDASSAEDFQEQAAGITNALAALAPSEPSAPPPTPTVAISLSNAIQAYDAAAQDVGLPSFREVALDRLPPEIRERAEGVLNRIDQAAALARTIENLPAGDEQAVREFTDAYLALFSNPALSGPGGVALTDLMAWNMEFYGGATDAIQLVAQAIDQGGIDREALQRVETAVNELRSGPWNGETMRNMIRGLCSQLPALSDLCEAVASEVVLSVALTPWEGTWLTDLGRFDISQWGGTMLVTPVDGDFIERNGGRFSVISSAANVITGLYILADLQYGGEFTFERSPDDTITLEMRGDFPRLVDGRKLYE